MIYKLAIVSGLAAAVLALPAQAGTQAEYQALRSWCIERDKHKEDSAWQANNYSQKYFHFHHYCLAMKDIDTIYRARNRQEVQYAISRVKDNLHYVISRYPAEYFLIPEVYALRGKAEYLGGSNFDAKLSLVRALQLDPNHVGAHITLVDLYVKMNRKAEAIKAIRAALAVAPEHKGVRRIALELGVEVPEIAAREKKLGDAPAQPEIAVVAPEINAVTDTAPTDKTTPDTRETETPKPAKPEPAIGMPGNPYCRFCTD